MRERAGDEFSEVGLRNDQETEGCKISIDIIKETGERKKGGEGKSMTEWKPKHNVQRRWNKRGKD